MMSFFTAQAQSGNPACCFWVENMQPVTAHHIANLNGNGIAQDTSAGNDLVLNNVLNRAVRGNTDVYTLHFPQGANCGQKVSIEWLLYRDGQLVNGNLSDYADFAIYTRYAPLNAAGYCQNIDWLGGIVENGDGICGCSVPCNDNNHYPCDNVDGHNDFPGARIADALTPPFHDMSHLAAGYTNQMFTYNYNYFYLRFLASAQSSTQIRIKWKQVGEYSLVVRIRERIGGNDHPFTMDGSQNEDMNIGGHMACCGDVLYQDSLHYLVTTNHEKSICEDNPPFPYGQGLAWGPNDSTLYDFYPANDTSDLYYVLFGTYTCDHWVVDSIDTFQLYARINPDIVAKDTILCRGDHFTSDDMNNLVTEVNLDAPGIIGHQIEWSLNGEAFSTDPLDVSSVTDVAGVSTFYVRQRNFYFDAMDNDTIGCPGDIDTITVTVRDLFPPVLENDHALMFCNETLEENSPLALTAHIDTLRDHCATEIRWYSKKAHTAANLLGVGDTLRVDLTQVNPTNIGKSVTYYLYTVNTNTDPVTFSDSADYVTITFRQTPVFTVDSTQLDFVVCPGSEVNMLSKVTCLVPNYNDSLPKLTFAWYKDSTLLSNDTNYTINASTVCNHKDTFTVKITAVSWSYGCTAEMTRTYTVLSQDTVNPVIAWVDTVGTFDTLGNRLVTLSGCDSAAVPAPYTVAQFLAMTEAPTAGSTTTAPSRAYVGTIIDGCSNVDSLTVKDVVTSQNACQTVVTRTYVGVDACDNHSNTITEIFTINNDYKPVITGRIDVNPVRDTACTYDVPSYAVLRNIFDTDTNIKVTYQCTKSAFDTVVFYMNNTNVVADGNLNIFADTDLVTIYAVVTDTCGNHSVKTPVFDIHKPAAMYIAHGSITLDTLELCADVTTNMHFNDAFVMNADRPYTYQWSQISAQGQSVITPDPNNYLEAVVSPESQNINTSSQFVMTVTDSLGCVASDTSNAVHFYMLPTAEIISHPGNTGNPINSGDTLCPNYGDFYMIVGPNTNSNLPDSVYHYQSLGYLWSGAADSYGNHTAPTEFFKMACENCDSLYTTYLTVTNMKNCSATTSFNIYGVIKSLPVITAISEITMPLVAGNPNCVISVPDFISDNSYFNPLTVQDECFDLREMEFSQDVKPDTLINHDTTVVITISAPKRYTNATPCWTVHHNIEVKMPANTIHITSITADNIGCEPLPVTLTPAVENAVGNITYAWSNGGSTETIGAVLKDTAHTYTLTVTDDAGCSNSMTVSPTVYRVPLATDFAFVSTPNTHCDNNYDGTFTLQVLNDTTSEITGFTYNGVDYILPDTVMGLDSGRYSFIVFTSHNCSATFGDSIVGLDTSDVDFVATRWTNNFMCEAPYSGAVQVTPQIENYIYTIESDHHVTDGEIQTGLADVITPLTFHYLYQDTYRVRILNTRGCHFVTNDVTVLDITDTPTTHIVNYDTADCALSNGVAYVLNTVPAYTYTLEGVTASGNNGTLMFTGLNAGTHTLHIVSSGLCTFDQDLVVPAFSDPGRPIVSIDTNRACTGGTYSGAITIAASNVKPDYTYKLYKVNGTTTLIDSVVGVAGTAIAFNGLQDGNYRFNVTDNHNCSANYDTIVPFKQFEVPGFTYVVTPGHDCANADNKITINNPNSDYYYVLYYQGYWDNSIIDTFPANGILDSIENNNNYFIRKIHKLTQCPLDSTTFDLHVVQPDYTFAVSHENDKDCSNAGTGTITVLNPNSAFTYYLYDGYTTGSFNPASCDTTGNVFTELDGNSTYYPVGQIYTIFAYNNNTHCNYRVYDTLVVDGYVPSVDTAVSTPNFMCVTDKNGTITVTLDSVVAGNFYLADSYTGSYNRVYHNIDTNTTGVFTGLDAGRYYVNFVSDLHCATGYGYIDVLDSAFINPHFLTTDDYTCQPTQNMPGTGCIYVIDPQVDATHMNYTYTLIQVGYVENTDIDRTSYKWCALAEGDYTVVIADTVTGCSSTSTVHINKGVINVTLNVASEDNNVCVGTGNGSITVTATADLLDAVLVYTIDDSVTWNPSGATVNNLSAGTYEIVVRDNYSNCIYDTCANKMVTINTVKKELNIDTTLFANNACDSILWNGSVVINSVEYLDGTAVDYTATITDENDAPVDYATVITNGWGHLNNVRYKINIHDNTTGCDTILNTLIPGNNSCSNNTTINVTAVNNNTNASNSAKEFYFCYNVDNAKLIANATSPCDSAFTYTWSRECKDTIVHNAEYDVNTSATICCKYYITAVGVETGCSKTDTVNVCVDELPSIQFYATGANIAYVGANPTVTFSNCENYAYTFGINNPAPKFDSISWTNGYVATNIDNFYVDAYTRPIGKTSYCVWVMDQNGCANTSEANVMIKAVSTAKDTISSCGSFDYTSHRTGTHYHYTYTIGGTNDHTVIDTFYAVNACDSIVTYTVHVNATPTLTVPTTTSDLLNTAYCHGNTLPATFTVTTTDADYQGFRMTYKDPVVFENDKTSFLTDSPFDPASPLTFAMSGKKIYAYAFNDCDTIIKRIGVLVVDSLPVVSGVTAASNPINFCKGSLCPGTELVASTTAWNNAGLLTPKTEKWLVSANQTDFSAATEIATFGTADSGKYVTFAATNHCGTTYATPVKVLVDSVADPVVALNTTTFCAGDAINMSNITLTHKATSTPEDTIYYYGGSEYTLGTALAKTSTPQEFYASVKYSCGSYVNSNKLNITVNDTANLVLPTTTDTLCIAGGAYNFTVNMFEGNTITAISSNNAYATVTVGTPTATSAPITVTPLAAGVGNMVKITITSTAAGTCGTKIDSAKFFIADTADNFSTVANVEACAGATITLSAPTYHANGNVKSEGWLLNGAAFDPTTTPVQKADSGKTLTYFVLNTCGTGHSNDAVLNVYDTAKLVVTGSVDTLCVGSTFNYTIDTNATNIVTFTPSANITFTHTGATVQVTAVTTGDAKLVIFCNGKNGCGEKKDSVKFVVSDLATVDNLDPIAAVCEGNALALTAPSYTNGNSDIHSEGWQVKKTSETSFSDFDVTTLMSDDYKNADIRYMVETKCGPAYSDTLQITVNDTAELTVTERTQVVCNNSAITDMVITRNKPVELSANLKTAGLGFSTDSLKVEGTVAIPATETFPYILTGKIFTTDVECPDKNDTLDIKITVNAEPVVTLTRPNDTICDGNPITITNLAIDTNHTAGLTTASGYQIKKDGATAYADWNINNNVDVTYDKASLIYVAVNGCGRDTSDVFTIRVAGHSTLANDAVFRDTCSGNPFSDFLVSMPTVTLTGAAVATDTTWYVVEGSTYTAITDASTINNPTSVACVVTNQCFSDTSNVVALGFDGVPTITPDPLTVAPICEGDLFTVPTFTVADNGGLIADTLWFINGTALDFTSIYDAATYNGKEIKLIVNNACGADTATGTATINVRPVPFMLADTVLCADPLNEFTLDVPNGPFVTYAWKDENGDPVSSNKTETIQLNTLAVDTVLKYYVVVTDANGCESQSRINRSTYVSDVIPQDTIFTDFIHVRVTTKPFFKFTNMDGVPTHDINSSLSNTTTAFKWTLDDKCYSVANQKVYVKFSIYHNGVLIPESEISNYLATATTTVGMTSYNWNTNQVAQYQAGVAQTAYSFYEHISNNFPNFYISSYKYDWVYLPFIASRYVTNTFAQFQQEGNYEIHYDLYATNGDQFGNVYDDYPAGATDIIGGHGITTSTLLASDVFTIHVGNGSTVAENEAPAMPEPEVIAEDPTVKVYPNPTSENVNVRIEGIDGQTTIRISTLTGKTVAQRNVNINNKFAIEQFNVSDLTPGVYVLQIVNEEAVISRKLVITK